MHNTREGGKRMVNYTAHLGRLVKEPAALYPSHTAAVNQTSRLDIFGIFSRQADLSADTLGIQLVFVYKCLLVAARLSPRDP